MLRFLKKITLKRYFIFFAFLWVIAFISFFRIPVSFYLAPHFQKFTEAKNLDNWDVARNAFGDFDNDGKEDFVSVTGCAFLSSTDKENVPPDQQCTNSLWGYKYKVGQKYIDTKDKDLSKLTERSGYSYMGKTLDDKWTIYANYGHEYFSEIDNGLVKRLKIIPSEAKKDFSLYMFLYFWFMFVGFLGTYFVFPFFILLGIMIFLFKIFKKRFFVHNNRH